MKARTDAPELARAYLREHGPTVLSTLYADMPDYVRQKLSFEGFRSMVYRSGHGMKVVGRRVALQIQDVNPLDGYPDYMLLIIQIAAKNGTVTEPDAMKSLGISLDQAHGRLDYMTRLRTPLLRKRSKQTYEPTPLALELHEKKKAQTQQ